MLDEDPDAQTAIHVGTAEKHNLPMDSLAAIIVCSHYPRDLFRELEQQGGAIVPDAEHNGICHAKTSNGLPTLFVITRELEYEKDSYEWFRWLRADLTPDDAHALAA